METKDPRLIVHQESPPNSETPLELLDAGLTPVPFFFTRNNFPVPAEIPPEAWRLEIDGEVERPLTIVIEDLRRLPQTKFVSVLECTGNGRGRFEPLGGKAEGLPWGEGAVANAEWQGVPVRHLFEEAGVKANALQAECRGAGLVRGVEVEKLLADGLFATEMNGQPLPHLHGGPVRLVVPGWGGINWVKWIESMTILGHESPSSFNQDGYVIWDSEGKNRGKATEMPIKSIFKTPRDGARLPAGEIEIEGPRRTARKGRDQLRRRRQLGRSGAGEQRSRPFLLARVPARQKAGRRPLPPRLPRHRHGGQYPAAHGRMEQEGLPDERLAPRGDRGGNPSFRFREVKVYKSRIWLSGRPT
jgi:DMSO/TMAO reductase YedYZ molybdopterin-dependent catalytic subunit